MFAYYTHQRRLFFEVFESPCVVSVNAANNGDHLLRVSERQQVAVSSSFPCCNVKRKCRVNFAAPLRDQAENLQCSRSILRRRFFHNTLKRLASVIGISLLPSAQGSIVSGDIFQSACDRQGKHQLSCFLYHVYLPGDVGLAGNRYKSAA